MRNFKLLSLLMLSILLGISCSENDFLPVGVENESVTPETEINSSDMSNSQRVVGNEAPNGAHYNLNIIGVQKDKTADMSGNNGHRIFVKLWGKSKINLIEGDDFQVLDANGTDQDGAAFQLPNPDPDGDGTTRYSIWARPLGTPGGSAKISLCADADLTDGYVEVCTADPLVVTSSKGPSKFKDVTKQLLTILVVSDIDVYGDGSKIIKAGRYTIFDDTFEDYFWDYDNEGLKLLQLRFYPVETSLLDS